MKKIGILTYHRAVNYGAILQAYALSEFLVSEGYIVEVIDYWPYYHSEEYNIFSFSYFRRRGLRGQMKYLFELPFIYLKTRNRKMKCIDFISNYTHLSTKIVDKNIKCVLAQYDTIIYGSDQIWRKSNLPLRRGFDPVYFGAYVSSPVSKVAYAASMGVVDISNDDKDFLIKRLSDFNSISVRENDLKLALEKLKISSTLVLDPVFLLNKTQWVKILPLSVKNENDKYILFYHHTPSIEANLFVDKLSKMTKLRVVEIREKIYPYLFGVRYDKNTSSPQSFLYLVKNAEFVVSTSFHGTVFSILFEKNFYVLGMGIKSSRVKSLLSILGIQKRYLDDLNAFSQIDLLSYDLINEKLNAYINISKQYLLSNL